MVKSAPDPDQRLLRDVAPAPWQRGSWWLVAYLLVIVAGGSVAAWLGPESGPQGLSAGALAAGGLGEGIQLGFDEPHAGIYYLAFAPLVNKSAQPVHVLGFWIAETSDNVRVLGYPVHSTDQFGGRQLAGYDPSEPDTGIDFGGARALRMPYVIPPYADSHRFAMAKVRLTAYPLPGFAKGCIVVYRLGSSTRNYVQNFDCTFYFGDTAQNYFDGRTNLDVVNSYRHDVLLVGCPLCKSKGIKLHGSPHARVGEGGLFGWELGKNDPRSLRAVVDGRPVLCKPPTGAQAVAYAARNGPDLTYDITPDGRCIAIH
jgi:hypothetical protein